MRTLNTKLLLAYRLKGLRAYKLAEMAEIENTRFCRIVNGKLKPKQDEKRNISKILKIPQRDLF